MGWERWEGKGYGLEQVLWEENMDCVGMRVWLGIGPRNEMLAGKGLEKLYCGGKDPVPARAGDG